MLNRANNWLETHWATPAYGGWLLAILSICFFGAATNTMAGWLYVLSGVGISLLGVGAVLPARSIQALMIERETISPVTAGADLEIALIIHNPTQRVRTLFQVQDLVTLSDRNPPKVTVEQVLAETEYRWVYHVPTEQRGVYRWSKVVLRSGAPIGLFWCQRYRQVPAIAYIYPQVLKLDRCPLIDGIGAQDRQIDRHDHRRLESANEGITRSLRPYRYGDSMRSIHWRTSARSGIFQVRELEIDRSGQDLVIYLDSGANWNAADFEQAVIAACTLYFYAAAQFDVKLWTAGTGLISGTRQVLETLAAVQMSEPINAEILSSPVVCLTSRSLQIETLPPGSHWVLWTQEPFTPTSRSPGIKIDPDRSLQQQLISANFASDRDTPIDVRSTAPTQNPQLN